MSDFISAFPKIYHLGSKQVVNIFEGEVEITEKIDGSQFAFVRIKDYVVCRSKGCILDLNTCDKRFKKAIEYVQSIKHLLPKGDVFYCELVDRLKHNILCYEKLPLNNLVLFAVKLEDNPWESHHIIEKWAEQLSISVAPLLFKGQILNGINPDQDTYLYSLIDKISAFGNTKMEGCVIKSLDYRILKVAKFVGKEFQEVAKRKKTVNYKNKLQDFFQSYNTEARWVKAVGYLRDANQLKDSMEDIGPLLKCISQDIEEEEKENIKEWLYEHYRKDLLKTATVGFVEWYRRKLLVEWYKEEYLPSKDKENE